MGSSQAQMFSWTLQPKGGRGRTWVGEGLRFGRSRARLVCPGRCGRRLHFRVSCSRCVSRDSLRLRRFADKWISIAWSLLDEYASSRSIQYAIRLTPIAPGFVPHKHKTSSLLSKLGGKGKGKSPSTTSDAPLTHYSDARGSYRIPVQLVTSHQRGMHLAGSFAVDPDGTLLGMAGEGGDSPAPTYEDDFKIKVRGDRFIIPR